MHSTPGRRSVRRPNQSVIPNREDGEGPLTRWSDTRTNASLIVTTKFFD